MSTLIQVEGLGKAYKRYPNRRARLKEWFWPNGDIQHEKVWVLKDISFTLEQGETVGIIGANGAGKSTLLKLISGVTRPTQGNVTVNGNIAALLELGMGFHPEFTGRQNVRMGGHMLGLDDNDISQLMPWIESFAEIGEYMDQPLRTYSSGMQVRLAFSLATARRPDLLIIDEALSVGDAYFQHKSFDRIREFKELGTTLLIVSHNNSAIQAVCDRALLIDQGQLRQQGQPSEVLEYFSAMMADKQHETIIQRSLADGSLQTTSGTGEICVEKVELTNEKGQVREVVQVGESLCLTVRLRAMVEIPRLVLGFLIKDNFGQPIYGINTHRLEQALESVLKGEVFEFQFRFVANLGRGHYAISLSASEIDSHLHKNYQWVDRAIIFHVNNHPKHDFVGCNFLNSDVDIKRIASS